MANYVRIQRLMARSEAFGVVIYELEKALMKIKEKRELVLAQLKALGVEPSGS